MDQVMDGRSGLCDFLSPSLHEQLLSRSEHLIFGCLTLKLILCKAKALSCAAPAGVIR